MKQNNQNKRNLEFQNMIKIIETTEWKTAILQAKQIYNFTHYNIEKLTIYKVRDLYYNISHTFYSEQTLKIKWHENQLRIFVWLLLTYSKAISKSIDKFDSKQWTKFSNIFIGKNQDLCEFQFLNLKRNFKRSEKWNKKEDQLLSQIVINDQRQIKNKWNEIAKRLFFKSKKNFFRTAKQCRQRWNNFLDPNKKHGNWSIQEDLILIQESLKYGKKWSNMARILDQTRTEHMVKNRYKSLLEKQRRSQRSKKKRSQNELLQQIQKKIQIKIKNQQKKLKIKNEQTAPHLNPINSNIIHHQVSQQQKKQNEKNAQINIALVQNKNILVPTPTTPSIIPYSPIQYSPYTNIMVQYNLIPNLQFPMICPNPFQMANFLYGNKFT